MGVELTKFAESEPCMSRTIDVKASTEPKSDVPPDVEDANIMSFVVPDDGEILKIEIADIVVRVDKKNVVLDTSNITQ